MLLDRYDWYSEQIPYHKNKKRIDYFLNNIRYKGSVEAYRNSGINNYLRISIVYADKAISVYEKIDKILKDKSLDSNLNLQLNSNYYGNYKTVMNENLPVFKVGYKTFTKNKDTINLFPFTDNKVIMDKYFLRFKKRKDTTYIYTNSYKFGQEHFAFKID